MKAPLSMLAALLVAGGASFGIAAAPVALAAAPTAHAGHAAHATQSLLPSCVHTEAGGGRQGGFATLCETPGNAQLDSRPGVL
ncbi:MAG: hypothetical protein K0U84_24535 [Actinomycetia bacterium]|nr:hypothetical protein [Actinomycetes bacterium]